jgi:polar amino acid transport system substrate-binding protein
MAWTRRQFLSRTTILGATAGSVLGCSSRVGGAPRPDPDARAPGATGAEIDPSDTAGLPDSVRVGMLNFEPYVQPRGTSGPADDVRGPVPDVARAVLEQLGVSEIKFELLEQQDLVMVGLQAGQFDLAGGLSAIKNFCPAVEFSVPDYVSGTALIVPTGNPKGLATYADVKAKGAKVAVMTNLPEQADVTAAGIAPGNVVPLPDPLQMMDAVADGQADCAAFDALSSPGLVKTHGGGLTTAKPFTPTNRPPLVGAFAFPKDNTDLLEPFNNRLRDLHESGDWLSIVVPYGFTEDNLPPPDLTTEEACAG